jgi:hypothetical protein
MLQALGQSEKTYDSSLEQAVGFKKKFIKPALLLK